MIAFGISDDIYISDRCPVVLQMTTLNIDCIFDDLRDSSDHFSLMMFQ